MATSVVQLNSYEYNQPKNSGKQSTEDLEFEPSDEADLLLSETSEDAESYHHQICNGILLAPPTPGSIQVVVEELTGYRNRRFTVFSWNGNDTFINSIENSEYVKPSNFIYV